MLRAIVQGALPYPRGGTALTVEISAGVARPGDSVRLALAARSLEVTIRGVGVVDRDVGRPTFHADIVLLVDGVEAGDVPPGTMVTS